MAIARTPAYTITIDGEAITDRFAKRLISLGITDKRGIEADQLDIVLSDHDGLLAIPPRNATLQVAIGWQGQALYDRGTYIIDEIEHSGAPDQLGIRGHSADFRADGPAKRSQSYHDTTIGAIVATIAARHALTAVTADALATTSITHIDQTNEGDFHFLSRLAERYDAIATVKTDRLLFTKRGQATTASGQPMPEIALTRRDGDQHRYAIVERNSYKGVIAQWQDLDAGKREKVIAGEEPGAKRLRSIYATEREAWDAANAELSRIQRGTAELGITLAIGRPDITPETKLGVTGFKADIDEKAWVITEVIHRIGGSGYTTRLTAETLPR